MSSQEIPDLPLADALTGAELFHLVQAGNSRGSLLSTLATWIIGQVVDSSPSTLDTLNELAAALGDDANYAATITGLLANKQPLHATLTALAALATNAYGRNLLTLVDTAAFMALVSYADVNAVRAGTASAAAIAPDALIGAAAPQVLVDQATVAWDMAAGFNAKVTLGGSRTIGTPTNPKVGLTYALEVIQDGTGSRIPTLPAGFKFGLAGAPTFSTGAGKRDFLFLYCYDAATPEFRTTFNKDS